MANHIKEREGDKAQQVLLRLRPRLIRELDRLADGRGRNKLVERMLEVMGPLGPIRIWHPNEKDDTKG